MRSAYSRMFHLSSPPHPFVEATTVFQKPVVLILLRKPCPEGLFSYSSVPRIFRLCSPGRQLEV
ncbi:hypothetical protein JZ751_003446 [Albula glossodonta]|uniref:Uncharacterized protein n=1 Tax=Albula glossodonta TaxID=121402 RepID=A0A8T2NHR0_9TELE|nr:hypothetical protein JZ751_003446 [Albula glossodonta]